MSRTILSLGTGYPDFGFSWFFLVLQGRFWDAGVGWLFRIFSLHAVKLCWKALK
jgi:hypothetical protein